MEAPDYSQALAVEHALPALHKLVPMPLWRMGDCFFNCKECEVLIVDINLFTCKEFG